MNSRSHSGKRSAHRTSTASKTGKRRDQIHFAFFATQIVALVFLQKISLPIGGGYAEAPLFVMYLGLAGLLMSGLITVDKTRLALYAAFAGAATICTLLNPNPLSVSSFILSLSLYLPLVVKMEVSESLYLRFISLFQTIMIGISAIVFLQFFVEIVAGPRYLPNIEHIIPTYYQFPGFVYLRAMELHAGFIKPNAFFMLEVSIVSQFIALSIVFEIVYGAVWWRLMIYVVALFATFAASGPLLLLVLLPVLFVKASPRVIAALTLAIVASLIFVAQTHWLAVLLSRSNEYHQYSGSANHRFIQPLTELGQFFLNPDEIFVGIGAGNIATGPNITWWPITKVTVEYGILTSALFFALLIYSMFKCTPDKRVALAIFLSYNFLNGSFAVPLNVFMCMIFCTFFEVRKSRRSRGRHSSVARPAESIAMVEVDTPDRLPGAAQGYTG